MLRSRWRVNSKGHAGLVALLVVVVIGTLIAAILPGIENANVAMAITTLEGKGYVVLTASEYDLLAKEATALAAVNAAQLAVTQAQVAVVAAQVAAAKVDLFNSAEVFLFPDTTNVTVTLTAGNTNQFGVGVEVVDESAATLSSKFAARNGYISDMYIYDHSAVDKLYMLELAYGDNKTGLGRVMYHTSFIEMAPIKSRLIPAGSTIYYRMMCSGANGATAKVGFRYFFE